MKYTLYFWIADNEGGYGICQSEKFNPSIGYNPMSGWRAKPSDKIGDFNTVEELAELLMKDDAEYFTKEIAMEEAESMMEYFEEE